jgi:Lar family restriction alleviation protein
MKNDLKPCPFCGGAAQLTHNAYGVAMNGSYVLCPGCGCTTKTFGISTAYASDEKATEAWNRRADDEQEA